MKILIVDDDPYSREMARVILEQAGHHEVTEADTPYEGFKVWLGQDFDVVLLDDVGPGQLGSQEFAALLRQGVSTPNGCKRFAGRIIGMTCLFKIHLSGAWNYFDEFLQKPFSVKGLLDTIEGRPGHRPVTTRDGPVQTTDADSAQEPAPNLARGSKRKAPVNLRLLALATCVAVGVGFGLAGVWGALTALIASITISGGLSIGLGMSALAPAPTSTVIGKWQRIGGFVSLVAATVGAVYGGWRWGWAWTIPGYLLGAVVSFVGGGIVGGRHHVGTYEETTRYTGLSIGEPLLVRIKEIVFENWPVGVDRDDRLIVMEALALADAIDSFAALQCGIRQDLAQFFVEGAREARFHTVPRQDFELVMPSLKERRIEDFMASRVGEYLSILIDGLSRLDNKTFINTIAAFSDHLGIKSASSLVGLSLHLEKVVELRLSLLKGLREQYE